MAAPYFNVMVNEVSITISMLAYLVFWIITYLLTFTIKAFCAVVMLGCIEEQLNVNLSPADRLSNLLNRSYAVGGLWLFGIVHLLIAFAIGYGGLLKWLIFGGTTLLIATCTADFRCADRNRRMEEGQGRSTKLWMLMLGSGINNAQQSEHATVSNQDDWAWIEMDNAPPLEGREDESDDKEKLIIAAEGLKSPKYATFTRLLRLA